MVYLFHYPNVPRNGYFLAHGRRHYYGAKLFGIAAHGVFLVLFKHRVKFKGIHLPLACKPNYKPAGFSALNVVCLN